MQRKAYKDLDRCVGRTNSDDVSQAFLMGKEIANYKKQQW